jgi:hypothetical protein
MSGVAQPTGDYGQDMQKTYTAIAKSVVDANPQLKNNPAALFDAVGLRIDQMKGLGNEDKAYLKYQTDVMSINERLKVGLADAQNGSDKIKASLKETQDKLAAAQQALDNILASKESVAKIGADSRLGAAKVGASARLGAASMGASSRENVAQTNLTGRKYSADKNLEGANVRAGASRDVANTGGKARVRSASLAAGKGDPGEGGGGVPAAAVQMLKKNPTPVMKKHFDDTFGQGSAAKALAGG